MSRPWQFLIFFSMATGLTGLVNYYIWTRLIRDIGLSGSGRTAATLVLWGLYLWMVAMMPAARLLPRALATPLAYVGFGYMGLMMLLLLLLLTTELPRQLLLRAASADPERRRFLQRALGLGTAALGAAVGGIALWGGLRRVQVRPVEVRLRRLPPSLSGLRIVQLTDIHIGPTLDGRWLERVVSTVNQLQADIIAITGDLVDGSVAALRAHTAPLAALRARHGVFFVTGNHEYYSGVEEWMEELSRLGVRVLRNERVTLAHGADGAPIDLAGVDDYHSDRFAGHGPNLPQALAGRDPQRPVVLLAHQPAAVREAAAHGVDLQLSGHTHGGQIWPWRYMVYLQQPYIDGLHRIPRSDTQIYVSRGTGYWGPPMRLAAPAEITEITLRAA